MGKPEGRRHLEGQVVDWRIIPKRIFEKLGWGGGGNGVDR